ncbi:Leucine-rich repeat transmembrane protein kinase protein [Striga hermonthica]|uniref:Leucine-rich repeat transmembrane protein kinase protein n=1 Tax=Striga hermonthica TaxID=68872 RepID=A0A9N7MR08_STRHE|nr:Leucine-rich repeat transmembrane protein kinase protein [Striga hermonthica]
MDSHSLLLIISALLVSTIFSVSADVFASIDCGSPDVYTDENLIVWTGDSDHIQNGEIRSVRSPTVSRVMDTLRVFSSRRKNCYSIPGVSTGERVQLRASFHYGNYDGRASPPTFDLQFDGNRWTTVETSSTQPVIYEAIYVAKGEYVSVCVAQTRAGELPFISALEVRSLDPTMYSHVDKNYPLLLVTRVAYGANQTIRYTDDPYDRIWTPVPGGTGLTSVASDAIFIDNSVPDNPPSAVLQNAVTTTTPSGEIQLPTALPPGQTPIYLNMYFSEVTQLDTTQRRSFQVLMDTEPLMDQPILPPYGSCRELYASNLTVSSNATFSLVPTKDSTLPPLINAMEVFSIGDVLTDGTDTKDVEGLASLQNEFAVLQEWSGDPCLPAPYSWDWINCTTDYPPRVSALYLSSFDLSGKIPDFSSMDALVTIDFRNNSLNGPIPEFLATFPNLKQLNLASNQLTGSVPNSLAKKNGLNLVVRNNPELCTSGNSCTTATSSVSEDPTGLSPSGTSTKNKRKNKKLPVILGTTIPSTIVIWALVGIFIILRRRRKPVAVATSNSGHQGGNKPQPATSPINPHMIGKVSQTILDEVKANIEDQISDSINQQLNGSISNC